MALEQDLERFTGTTQYYRHPLGLRFTDGVKHLADQAGAHWLIDLVASYQPRLRNVPFQLWQMTVEKDRSARVTMREDTNQPTRIQQDIPYTDFPLAQYEWYTIDQTMLLKNEY